MAQILATALMLAAMRERSFSVVTAMIKTEPVQTALFGLALLGDPLTPPGRRRHRCSRRPASSSMSTKPRRAAERLRPAADRSSASSPGAFFALAAIGFRGAILSLDGRAPS